MRRYCLAVADELLHYVAVYANAFDLCFAVLESGKEDEECNSAS